MKDVGRLLGFILLLVGAVLLFCGWQSQQAMTSSLTEVIIGDAFTKTIILLSVGVLTAVGGLYAILRPS